MKKTNSLTPLFFFFITFFFIPVDSFTQSNPLKPTASWVDNNVFYDRYFVKNDGQFEKIKNENTLFGSINGDYNFYIREKGYSIHLTKSILTENEKSESEKEKSTTVKSSIDINFIEGDATITYNNMAACTFGYTNANINNAKAFELINYKNVYPNIDAQFSFAKDEFGIKYKFIVNAGADISKIKMKYTNQKEMYIDNYGNLHVLTEAGEIVDRAPITYYENGEKINSKFVLNNNILSFKLEAVDSTKKIIIDPWIVNPAFTLNKAFDITKDGAGNVYVYGDLTAKLKKFSPTGTLIWTHITPYSQWYGDLAVDLAGNSYITEGCCTGGITKISTNNAVLWTQSYGVQEFWNLSFNCDFTKLYVAQGYATSPFQFYSISTIDFNTGALLGNTVVATDEPRFFCAGPNGNMYLLTSNNNQLIAVTSAFTPIFNIPSTYVISYNGPSYATFAPTTSAQNGLSVGSAFFCTSNGLTLYKRDLATGASLGSVAIPSGIVEGNSGLYIDDCNNIYAGSSNGIYKFDQNLNLVTSTNTTGAVYCITPGANGEILACGNGFIGSYNFSSATPSFTQSQTNAGCSGCNGTATIAINCGNPNYDYIWSNASNTLNSAINTNTITNLCPGTYTVTVNSLNKCSQITAIYTITGVGAITSVQNPIICIGSSFILPDGSSVNTSGTYIDTLTITGGCDSIITTNLIVTNNINTSQSPIICSGNSFTLPDGSIVTTSGTYIDTLNTIGGCDSIITTNLIVTSTFTISQNPTICTGNNFTLPNGSIVTASGTYIDTLNTIGGCDSIITTNLIVANSINTSQSPTICSGNSFTLPDGSIVTVPGTYIDTLNTIGGCDSIITTNLIVTSSITISNSPIICSGNSFTLPNGSTVSSTGNYIDTLTSSGGCDSIISTNLTVLQNSANSQNLTICSGSNFMLPSGILVNSSGTYIDTILSANGCDSIFTTNLIVNSIPTVSVSPDITILTGANTTLIASGGGTYIWTPPNGLNTTTGATVIAAPNQTTIYCAEVTDVNGCKDSACVTVTIEIPCPTNIELLTLPNAFSPNNDGVNEEFCLLGWEHCIKDFKITIFDRWGEKVYESEDPTFCWNGTYKGKVMDAQVFVYFIGAKHIISGEKINIKGNISLIK